MRELPEFQVLANQFDGLFNGKILTCIEVINHKKIKEKPEDLNRLNGNVLQSIGRLGKELQLRFSCGAILEMDLKSHGRLESYEKINRTDYTVLKLSFSNGKGMALTDFQGNATITLNPKPTAAIDALSKDVYPYLLVSLQIKTKIKTLLTSQKVIRGIGNVYADEILWEAGISPFSISSAIPEFKIKALANATKKVLLNAEKQITGKRIPVFSTEVYDFMNIYGKEGEKSPSGRIIKVVKKGGHCTYYTEEQVLYA